MTRCQVKNPGLESESSRRRGSSSSSGTLKTFVWATSPRLQVCRGRRSTFTSRAELLVATTHYVDQVKGLHERNSFWRAAETGTELLDTYVEFWARYIPEIYELGRALLAVRDIDEAAATAWDDRMVSLRKGCRRTVEALERDGGRLTRRRMEL